MIRTKSAIFSGNDAILIRAIRTEVFTGEQNIAADVDFDGQDQTAMHCLAYSDDVACGTARMLSDGHIGRVAVLMKFRGQGLGAGMIECLVRAAKKKNYPRVYLGAQKHAESFYRRLGFTTYGDEYIEAGIEHVHMEKLLTPR